MSDLTRWLDSKLYPSFRPNWDDDLFREEVLRRLKPEHHVLDLGAGAGIVPQMDFKGRAARVCGVDPDIRVHTNPFLDEGSVAAGESLPYPDSSFDIVISDNVVEHLPDPVAVFKEVARVMKRGGVFLFKTPNKLHYVPTIARLTPHWFHQMYNKLRGRAAADTFPTCYRANTPSEIARAANLAHLTLESVKLVEGRPEYLRPIPLAYLAGWMYERTVNRFSSLERFRVVLIAALRRG